MHERYRGFAEEYRLYVATRGAWPAEKDVRAWFKSQRTGLKSGVYSAVKHGGTAGAKFVTGFLQMLLAAAEVAPEKDPLRHARHVLADFLRERGIQTLTQVPFDSMLAHIAGPLTNEKPEPRTMVDYLRRGIIMAFELAMQPHSVDRFVHGCHSEDDVREAVRWAYVCLGQSVGPDGPRTPMDEAVSLAEQHLRLPLAQYQSRAIAWQRFNPWTVVYARDNGVRLGMSSVLPINDKAYQEMLDGKRATSDMTPDDFVGPCTNLIIEAGAECPSQLCPRGANPTKPLLMSLALQSAALSRCRELPWRSEVRFLSFSATPRNRSRLLDTGFVTTGRTMARTGWEIFVRSAPLQTLRPDLAVSGALLLIFSEVCDRPPPR